MGGVPTLIDLIAMCVGKVSSLTLGSAKAAATVRDPPKINPHVRIALLAKPVQMVFAISVSLDNSRQRLETPVKHVLVTWLVLILME